MNIRVPILPAKLHTCFKTANLSARNLSPTILKKQKTITPGAASPTAAPYEINPRQPTFSTKMTKNTQKNFQIKKNFVTLPLDKGSAPARGKRPATEERCRSGRSGRSRKPLYPYGYPGFESLSFRKKAASHRLVAFLCKNGDENPARVRYRAALSKRYPSLGLRYTPKGIILRRTKYFIPVTV